MLDIDPGQPEYSVPGQLSLVHVREPNLSPQFAHPSTGASNKLIRAHTIAASTPAQDPDLYMKCVLDLISQYRQLSSRGHGYPLVINTPGWVLGTGLEILVALITRIRPSDVIYMSQEGPSEVVSTLTDAAKNTPFYTLPSQTSEYTTRTAAHLRAMQTMSYFHLCSASNEALSWNPSPLTSIPPWEIRYAGEGAGILGILTYGEHPSANTLLDSINGSVVAVVVIDELDAIHGLKDEYGEDFENIRREGLEKVHQDTELSSSFIYRPLIIRTPDSEIPYFNPLNTLTLDPQYSHCIGLALVRGIDVTRRRLQVLTPISTSVIEKITEQGKGIVLVSGKFDTPGWAYTEDMIMKAAREKEETKGAVDDVAGPLSGEKIETADHVTVEAEFGDVPWVETLQGSQGRDVGSRVWRVRRDLGRTEGGE